MLRKRWMSCVCEIQPCECHKMEVDILLGGVTWYQKQHSESINGAEIDEL